LTVCLSASLLGQNATELLPEGDAADLYTRSARSQLIVVGTVTQVKGILRRRTPEVIQEMRRDISAGLGGPLYVVRVDRTLCQASDFAVSEQIPHPRPSSPSTVTIFVPRAEPSYFDRHKKENLSVGNHYLLFLVVVDKKNKERWVTDFELSPNLDYFRGEELSRGIVPMPSPENKQAETGKLSVLQHVEQLCAALRPDTMDEKLVALKRLKESSDPVLQKEAEIAIQDLAHRSTLQKH
jgi:hypothetical protein